MDTYSYFVSEQRVNWKGQFVATSLQFIRNIIYSPQNITAYAATQLSETDVLIHQFK
jgi:hypothetical protein